MEDVTERRAQRERLTWASSHDSLTGLANRAAGDALLRQVAHVLAAQVRKSDTVARLGGDEFAVLLDRCPVAQAQAVAEKIRCAVVACELVWDGAKHTVGASIGLVPVNASLCTAAEVLSAADAACYAAKRRGRNRVAMHTAA